MKGGPSLSDLESAAQALESSGDYRVLRRLKPRTAAAAPSDGEWRIGIILDVETTGLNANVDEIIELAMIKVAFRVDGLGISVLDRFSRLREPRVPIPEKVTALTGLTAESVAGHTIAGEDVAAFVRDAVLIIAHNASFDRPFCEMLWPIFVERFWACSATDVDWEARGHSGSKLAYLLNDYGLFHDGHRAASDCEALLEVLVRPRHPGNGPALAELLVHAREATVRIWAVNAPFAEKERLKARGYRWSDGSDGQPRAWWTEVAEEEADDEMAYLRREILQGAAAETPTRRITGRNRYSRRAAGIDRDDVT